MKLKKKDLNIRQITIPGNIYQYLQEKIIAIIDIKIFDHLCFPPRQLDQQNYGTVICTMSGTQGLIGPKSFTKAIWRPWPLSAGQIRPGLLAMSWTTFSKTCPVGAVLFSKIFSSKAALFHYSPKIYNPIGLYCLSS